MRQKLLIYKGKLNNEKIIFDLAEELGKYYYINIVEGNSGIRHKSNGIIIVFDIMSFFLQNCVSCFSNIFVWYDEKIKYLLNDMPVNEKILLENNINIINAIITTNEDLNIIKTIKYQNTMQLLKLFGYYDSTIKVKIMCNWESSEQIVKNYNKLCHANNMWNNIEITSDDYADYFCILNFPQNNDYYKPEKTIIIMMEEITNRKVFFPKEWINPEPHKFMYYYDKHNGIEWHLSKNWEQLMTEKINKTKILSSVTSSEYRLDGHIKRINFLKFLDSKIEFDLYGKSNKFNMKNYKGSLPYLQKDEGILPYKYTIACENNSTNGYFTEKIVDAILGECLCFYWGCPNLENFIDSRAFIRINLDNHEESMEIILNAINNDEWEKRINVIRREKNKILNEIQLLPTIEKIISESKINPDYNNNNLTEYFENKEKFLSFHGDLYMIDIINYLCKKTKYCIESGAYRAASSRYVAINNNNIKVYTCETNYKSYIKCVENTDGINNIKVFHDNSLNMLKNIKIELNLEESTLFHLDGHSHNDSNIIEELKFIFDNFKNYYIIIDDFKNEYHNEFSYIGHLKNYTYNSIKKNIPLGNNIYFPDYTEKTSTYHPLVGWILITNNNIDNHENLKLVQHNLPSNLEIKVVNLDRRVDRWNSFIKNTNNLQMKYNRFSAVDGKELKLTDEIKKIFTIPNNFIGKRWQFTHQWKTGVLGCAMSHIQLWRDLLLSNKDIYVILEDDVMLTDDFDNELHILFNTLKNDTDWDLLYLGINDDNYSDFYEDYFIYEKIMKFSNKLRLHGGGTYGYCINKKGAQKLINLVDSQGVHQPIDHFMIDQFDYMTVYKTVPHLVRAKVYTSENDDTDIQNVHTTLQ